MIFSAKIRRENIRLDNRDKYTIHISNGKKCQPLYLLDKHVLEGEIFSAFELYITYL